MSRRPRSFATMPSEAGLPPEPAVAGPMRHGGDLDEADRCFPGGPRPWIDLSTGVNPVAYPLPHLPPACFARLPSRSDLAALEAVAAQAYGAGDPATVVAAPGTQALIGWLPRLRAPGGVVVVTPTYAEHAAAWRQAGHRVAEVEASEAAAAAAGGVFVLASPNNPDGRIWPAAVLRTLAERLRPSGGWLVVDEAFADLETDDAVRPGLPDNVIRLRSFGKSYGLAGLRLGFAVAPVAVAAALRGVLGPWPVSGPAIAIARAALADAPWRRGQAAARAVAAGRLDEAMTPVVDRLVGGTCLFRLYELAAAPALFGHLGRHGIFVRRFEERPAWLRVAPPGSPAAWDRLLAALQGFSDERRSGACR